MILAFGLSVPLPLALCSIDPRHKVYEQSGWRIYTPRHEPAETLEGHLTFALKYEGLDLLILKRLFETVNPGDLEVMIGAKPNSAYMRRLWFLYEWLLDRPLDIEDAKRGTYADIVHPKLQLAVICVKSTRHRVRNNLPGTPSFCPPVRRTEQLDHYVEQRLDEQAHAVISKVSSSVLARTAAFLLLKDSKSSYAIEGEAPPHDRIQRWGKAIGEAGRHPLDDAEFLRLQKIVIGKDTRFVRLGLRTEDGFIGKHDRETRQPLPDHISARHQDLADLMTGLIAFENDYAVGLDAVIAAASLAFGFVYIHPFEDGNGRIHRYLIHHVLSARGFNPAGLIFPVSAVMLDQIEDYRQVLESYSARLLPLIEWQPTQKMNVEVLNDTGDFYRYFDATTHAEFLYQCVQRTIEHDLPEEAAFLERYDLFRSRIEAIADMPGSMIDLLFSFLKQNGGQLSKRARGNEFDMLTDDEVRAFETAFQELFYG